MRGVLSTILAVMMAVSYVAPGIAKQHGRVKRAPLPKQLIEAKTVYIDNDSGDRIRDELKRWGRFQMVGDRQEADLIFQFSKAEQQTGYVTRGATSANGRVDEYGNVQMSGTTSSRTVPTVEGATTLNVIRAKTGEILWSTSEEWQSSGSRRRNKARGLIKELRKQIQEQEDNSR